MNMSEQQRQKLAAAVTLGRLGGLAGRGPCKARPETASKAGKAGAAVRWKDHVKVKRGPKAGPKPDLPLSPT